MLQSVCMFKKYLSVIPLLGLGKLSCRRKTTFSTKCWMSPVSGPRTNTIQSWVKPSDVTFFLSWALWPNSSFTCTVHWKGQTETWDSNAGYYYSRPVARQHGRTYKRQKIGKMLTTTAEKQHIYSDQESDEHLSAVIYALYTLWWTEPVQTNALTFTSSVWSFKLLTAGGVFVFSWWKDLHVYAHITWAWEITYYVFQAFIIAN